MTSAHGQLTTRKVSPGAHAKQRRDHGDGDGGEGDDGGVDAGKARDEVLGARLLLAGVFHELEDAAHGRRAEELGGADAQDAGHVDAAGDDLAAHLDVTRHGLAGKGGGVELRGAVDHDAVDRHALAGLDHDDVADLHLIRIDFDNRAVALDVGVIGGDIHHGGDGLAALAHGVALEQFAHLVEEHDGSALGHVRFGLGEEDHGECADGGDGHEEALVEGLATADVAPRLEQDVVSCDEVGDEVEREARVQRARLAEDAREHAELVERHDGEEEREREQNALQPLLLLFVHEWSNRWGSPVVGGSRVSVRAGRAVGERAVRSVPLAGVAQRARLSAGSRSRARPRR